MRCRWKQLQNNFSSPFQVSRSCENQLEQIVLLDDLICVSLIKIIVQLIGLAILSGYLLHKHRERERRKWAAVEPVSPWNGKVLKVETVLPQIERLRENHLSKSRPAAHAAAHRKGLMGQARISIGRFSYFCGDGNGETISISGR